MTLSLPRMIGLFNSLSHRPPTAQGLIASHWQPAALPPAESPGFLHAGFAAFEPDLAGEIRQALGEQAARREGDVP